MKFKFVLVLTLILLTTSCGGNVVPKESSLFYVDEVRNCRITAPRAEVKSGAGESFKTVDVLTKGDEVKVLGRVNNWYVVQLDNNQIGCIDSALATPIVREDAEAQQPEVINQADPTAPQAVRTPDAPAPTPAPAENRAQTQTPAAERLTDIESRMVELVNAERQKNNLPPLKVDLELTNVARIKSQDMIDNNYFAHNSPTYGSPSDMMKQFGIDFLYAGENLALNSSVERAHESLMGSSGHRKNILQPNFTHIGIGVKQKGRSYYFTQMFVGRPK